MMAADKIPLTNFRGIDREAITAPLRASRKRNAVLIKGVEYHLGATELNDDFMHDFETLGDREMIDKYGLVATGVDDDLDEMEM